VLRLAGNSIGAVRVPELSARREEYHAAAVSEWR